jgi:uncharacterized protein
MHKARLPSQRRPASSAEELERDPARVKLLAEAKRGENVKLVAYLEHGPIAPGEIDRRFRLLYDLVRSGIDCTACASCCRELPIPVKRADARRLAEHLGQTMPDFRADHVRIKNHREVFALLPCQFLAGTRCAHYDFRPDACRSFPYLHLPNMRGRLSRVVDDAATCPIVYGVLEGWKRELGNRWRRR